MRKKNPNFTENEFVILKESNCHLRENRLDFYENKIVTFKLSEGYK